VRHAKDSDGEIRAVAKTVIKRTPEFAPIREANLRVLFVWRDKPRFDDDNYPVAARVSILPSKWRDVLEKDVEVEVCVPIWKKLNKTWRERLIEHEFRHVEIEEDPEGNGFAKDNEGRIKVKLIPHDIHLRTFSAEIEKWGFSSAEVVAAAFIAKRYTDLKKVKQDPYALPEVLQPKDDDGEPEK
jgi:hypothetical protein